MAAASLKVDEKYKVPTKLKTAIGKFVEAVSEDSVKNSLIASLGINDAVFAMYLDALTEAFES